MIYLRNGFYNGRTDFAHAARVRQQRHIYYENLYRYNPNNTSGYLLNSQNVTRKSRHFVINPTWDKQKLKEEMTFAYDNRGVATNINPDIINHNGNFYPIIETKYQSTFSDGTKVIITYKTKGIDPLSGNLVDNHIALLAIEP